MPHDHTVVTIRNVTPEERRAKQQRGALQMVGGGALMTFGAVHAPYARDMVAIGRSSNVETARSLASTADLVRRGTGRFGGVIGIGLNQTKIGREITSAVSPKLAGLGLLALGTGVLAQGHRLRTEARQGR